MTEDRFAYVQESFGLSYGNRWIDIGYLVVFICVFQILHFWALKYVSHIKR